MAHVHRFVQLSDQFGTQAFTFILPSSLLLERSPDIVSRAFLCHHHRWCVSFVKDKHHIGAYLTLKDVSDGMTCDVDFTFTMLNKDHFTKNESFTERGSVFSTEHSTQGRKTFVGMQDVASRGFVHEGTYLLVELQLRSVIANFEQVIQLSRNKDHQGRIEKFETSYFSFGNYDWNLSVYPHGDHDSPVGQPNGTSLVYLTRQTNFDHTCRVRYRIIVGQGDHSIESGVIEQLLDASGSGRPYDIGYNAYNLTSGKGRLRVRVELLFVSAISEVNLCVLNRKHNRAHLYDRDKQEWMIESDVSLDYLRLRLFYANVNNVPRNHMRYVCWSVKIIPHKPYSKPVAAKNAPFCFYYNQADGDDGYDICTDIRSDELRRPDNMYLDPESQRLTLHVEWLDSHLLHNAKYQSLDDVSSKQRHQMWRELLALQSENLALEKQLHSYQQSIAKNNLKDGQADGQVERYTYQEHQHRVHDWKP